MWRRKYMHLAQESLHATQSAISLESNINIKVWGGQETLNANALLDHMHA